MSASVVVVTQMACVGLAWGIWSSAPRVAPSMVAVPCMVMKPCSAGDSLIFFVVMRWMASIVTTPGRISFQFIVPVGNLHVGVMLRVWLPSRGIW